MTVGLSVSPTAPLSLLAVLGPATLLLPSPLPDSLVVDMLKGSASPALRQEAERTWAVLHGTAG
jgi:hypothetical protein